MQTSKQRLPVDRTKARVLYCYKFNGAARIQSLHQRNLPNTQGALCIKPDGRRVPAAVFGGVY